MISIRPEILEKVSQYIKENPEKAKARTRDDSIYNEFISLYPQEKILKLTLDEYCTGNTKNYPNNFSNWIEYGLKKCLGGYFGGGASPHLIYKAKDTNDVIKVPPLDVLTDEQALQYVLHLHSLIVNCDVTKDISWLADDELLQKKLGLDEPLIMPDTRKLRVLCAYHPDDVVHVFSKKHIQNFLLKLTGDLHDSMDENAIVLSQKLKECWIAIKRQLNLDHELSIHGFMIFLYYFYDIEDNDPLFDESVDVNMKDQSEKNNYPLNQILYGPPGTGKTYGTVEKSVQICDPDFKYDSYKQLKQRYDELVSNGQISFVTFHQSFSYEDFVEGIRAATNQEGQIQYFVEDGIFKEICQSANAKETIQSDLNIQSLEGRNVWKMSLGDTLNDEESLIYEECISNNYVVLGYGYDFDYSACSSYQDIETLYLKNIPEATKRDFSISAVNCLKNKMKQGDLIIITDGNRKFRAIAEIVSDYYLLDSNRNSYRQARNVKWLQVFESSISGSLISCVHFSQMSIYQINKSNLKEQQLLSYIQSESKITSLERQKKHVLIIDEINRGNIANIFGELITLLESSK